MVIRNNFKDLSLPRLGFGTMRLPVKEDGSIDQAALDEMVDYALANGVNYFDTAVPYHNTMSEIAIGKSLARYPRDNFYLATKFPGHQILSNYDPAAVFEEQLKKCQVEYFDFYLLHNVYERSMPTYLDPKWGIIDYFLEQKRLGRIKHLGFSTHAGLPALEKFLEARGSNMEFCQIQCNYLDWSLQNAKAKYELLARHNIPVWVMEPARGGKLAKLSDENEAKLRALRPDESDAAWSFRWLMGLDNIKMILSGMSNLEQMKDNIKTFSGGQPLSESERSFMLELAETMKDGAPCTACRYCCEGCPMQLDIPTLLHSYNDIHFAQSLTPLMLIESLPEDKKPSACIGCGACTGTCPQKINVPEYMAKLAEEIAKLPSWAEQCRQREELAARKKAEASKAK